MIINIKSLILEAGIVDDVQTSLTNGLVGHDSVGKAIDRQTAGEIEDIRKQVDLNIKGPVAKKSFETKKVITESIIGTKFALVKGGIPPTNEIKEIGELKGMLNTHQGKKNSDAYAAAAGQGKLVGERSKPARQGKYTPKNNRVIQDNQVLQYIQGKQVLIENTGPSDMGRVKPLPKRVSGELTDARNDKNATLKDHEEIPSAYTILKNNPTHNAKFGQKFLRDEAGQTNANGEGVE